MAVGGSGTPGGSCRRGWGPECLRFSGRGLGKERRDWRRETFVNEDLPDSYSNKNVL